MPGTVADSQVAYCRAARRLRERHARRPAALYRSLRQLSDQYDQAQFGRARLLPSRSLLEQRGSADFDELSRVGASPSRPTRHAFACDGAEPGTPGFLEPASPAEQFARMVAGRLENGVLRYSARVQLLAAAEAMDLGRFQANLIIAAVQHQAGTAPLPHPPPEYRRRGKRAGRLTRSSRVVSRVAVAVVLVIQLLIVLAAWGLWIR